MYAFRILLVIGAALVGLLYVAGGFACYVYGYRREHARLHTFGRTVVTFAPAPLLAAVVAFFVQLVSDGPVAFAVVAVLLGVGVVIPPVRGLLAVFSDN